MIPNQWYGILRTQDVGKKPVGVKRMGERLVLFRDRRGEIVCLHDRCPHKGALLSLGRVMGDTIECPYHGFQYGADGNCTLMPVLGKKGRIPHGMCTKSYRVREKYGYVWLWWGDDRPDSALPEIPMFDMFKDDSLVRAAYGWDAPVHYTRYVESVCELFHVPFVHRGGPLNFWDPKGGRVDDYRYEVHGPHAKSEFVLRPDDDRSAEETLHSLLPWKRGWKLGIELLLPNMILFLTPVFDVTFIMTPIDEENTWVCVCFSDLKRELMLPFLPPMPLPRAVRQARPWLLVRMERFLQQSKDMRVMRDQTPRVSGVGVNRLVAADALNAFFLKAREHLKQEAAKTTVVDGREHRRVDLVSDN
jgi:nitrite reductase/ring-hydroxylating ferredoxin subunit